MGTTTVINYPNLDDVFHCDECGEFFRNKDLHEASHELPGIKRCRACQNGRTDDGKTCNVCGGVPVSPRSTD